MTEVDRPRYKVIARSWQHGWELHVLGVGVTQSHGVDDAEQMARDYITSSTGQPGTSFDVEVIFE